MNMKIALSAFALFAVAGCATAQMQVAKKETLSCEAGLTKRAAIDLGSTGARLFFGCVSSTPNQFNKYTIAKLFKGPAVDIDFAKELADTNNFDDCENDESLSKVGKLWEAATNEPNLSEIRTGGTAAFRLSANGDAYISELNSCFEKMGAQKLTQEHEGELEFRGVMDQKKNAFLAKNDYPFVWGIGSTSIQLSTIETDNSKISPAIVVFAGDPGSSVFCNEVLSGQLNNQAQCSETMKPHELGIGENLKDKLVANRQEEVVRAVPADVRANINGKRIYGVGSIEYLALERPVSKLGRPFTLADVELEASKKYPLKDAPLSDLLKTQGHFLPRSNNTRAHEATVTLLILVEGQLKGLGAGEVEWVKASVADGLLISEQWPMP